MELKDEEFWSWLRERHDAAVAAEAEEFAEVERMLAQLDEDSDDDVVDEPLPAAQIEEFIQAALAATAAETDNENATPPTGQPRWWVRAQRAVAAAAALMIAPKFIVAASAVTVVAVSTYVGIRYSTFTLPYQDAVDILVDVDRPEVDRNTAQRRITGDLIGSILALRTVAPEANRVGRAAQRALDELRVEVASPSPFSPTDFPDMHSYLGDLVLDKALDAESRLDALRQLSAQMHHGVQALHASRTDDASDAIRGNAVIALDNITQLLGG